MNRGKLIYYPNRPLEGEIYRLMTRHCLLRFIGEYSLNEVMRKKCEYKTKKNTQQKFITNNGKINKIPLCD